MKDAIRTEPTEAEFTRQVVQLAQLFGWRVHHQRPGLTRSGKWCSAIQGHAGLPDIVATRRGRLLIAELKVGRNRVTSEQRKWLDAFREVPGVAVYEWRPCDFGEIESVLMG